MFDTKLKPLFSYLFPKFPLSTFVERGTGGEVFGEKPDLSNHSPVFK
jgi:hypothetical protein